MSPARSVLHLVRGSILPVELVEAPRGDIVVFLDVVPSGTLPPCRLLEIGPGSSAADGIRRQDLLDLIFQCDAVVTW